MISAGDGLEAIRAWIRGRPEAVLLDGSMPGLDGWSCAARIRKAERALNRPACVLVSISGDRTRGDGELMALRFDHRLPEPADLRALGNLVSFLRAESGRAGSVSDPRKDER